MFRMISIALYIVLGGGIFALVFAFGKTRWIYRRKSPTRR